MSKMTKNVTLRSQAARPAASPTPASRNAKPPVKAIPPTKRWGADGHSTTPIQPPKGARGGRVGRAAATMTPSQVQRAYRGNEPAKGSTADIVLIATPRSPSKKATITALIQRAAGATLADLITATGWQQHSLRAALTGLRKAGHQITRQRDDAGATSYYLVATA